MRFECSRGWGNNFFESLRVINIQCLTVLCFNGQNEVHLNGDTHWISSNLFKSGGIPYVYF